MFISVPGAVKPKLMSNLKPDFQKLTGGFYGHDFTLEDSALLAFEKLRHKRRVKKSAKYKPKRTNSS